MSASTTLWRRVLIYTHRWLGIAGSLLFVVWFVSGIVMMYAGMPSLTTEERLSHVAVLDLSRARVDVSEAAEVEDADRVFALGEEVYTTCNNCHMLYWIDDADRGRAIESSSGGGP